MAGRRSQVEDSFLISSSHSRSKITIRFVKHAARKSSRDSRCSRPSSCTDAFAHWLPRQGLFYQACRLVDTARHMEHSNPVGHGAVTEFDDLFQIAFKSMVRCLVRNAYQWQQDPQNPRMVKAQNANAFPRTVGCNRTRCNCRFESARTRPGVIGSFARAVNEILLGSWLSHSRTLRLSVLEPWMEQVRGTSSLLFYTKVR